MIVAVAARRIHPIERMRCSFRRRRDAKAFSAEMDPKTERALARNFLAHHGVRAGAACVGKPAGDRGGIT
jgi:hypothetical protein